MAYWTVLSYIDGIFDHLFALFHFIFSSIELITSVLKEKRALVTVDWIVSRLKERKKTDICSAYLLAV